MKKRLFIIIMLISVAASILSCALTTYIYYNFYVAESKNQLKTIVQLKSDGDNWENENAINLTVNRILNATDYGIRFTIIQKDGNVLYDSWAKDPVLENHKDRPEVSQAFEKGYGEQIRYSQTIDKDMYYYAYRINEDEVLRVSREINSINSVFMSIIPMLFVLFAGLLIVVYAAASMFIKKILEPVNEMTKSLDDMLEGKRRDNFKIYEEFEPLSHKILEQKIKINQYIDELKRERDTINIITENMKEGFILINRDKNILSINTSGRKMIGNQSFDLKDKKNILELTRNSEILDIIDTAIMENKHMVYDDASNKRYFRYYFSPVTEQEINMVAGLLILIEDVTIQKNAEIMRSEFSANVSHELKTPLTTINGFAEMIKEGLITDLKSIQKYCGLINKEGLRLISLIEDIMRLSKIEEKVNVEVDELVNLREAAEYVLSVLKIKADSLNISLNLKSEDVFMKANKNYMNELLFNLVDNSIKYNKIGGYVNVEVGKSEEDIIISVRDNGVGIAKEHQERIFERFYRVDKSRSKDTGGTGLGLSIVKHIAELYDGFIHIESEEQKGTEITVKFHVDVELPYEK